MRVCPFCSTENEVFFRFCLGCGADLDEALGGGDGLGADGDTPADGVDSVAAPADDRLASAPPPPPPPPAGAKGRTSASDTAVDMPAVTPELLAEMQGKAGKATRGPEVRAAAPVQPRSAKPGEHAPTKLPSVSPPAPTPRAAKDRDKTEEAGGALKPGSPASQAVAQAQSEAMRRRATQAAGSAISGAGAGAAVAGAGAGAGPVAPAVRPQESAEPPPPGAGGPSIRTKPSAVSNTKARPTSAGAAAIKAPATQSSAAAQRKASTPEVQPPQRKASGEKPKGRLVIILEDGTDGSVLDLSPVVTTIGREGVDISFPHDDFLAKRHAEFVFSDGMLLLKPLESTNGVFLQVHQEVELDSGDVFRIGQQLLCFEMLGVVASALEVDPKGQAIPLGSPVPEGAWGRLGQVIAPNTLGSVYLLGGSEVYLGRERGDITFPGDGFVSGLHAQISMRNGRCFLKDLGSSNGTYLRLSKPTPVRRGMLVLAGQQLFRVEG